jgi:hypothetical protein
VVEGGERPENADERDADHRRAKFPLGDPAEPHGREHEDDQRADDEGEFVVRRERVDGPVLHPARYMVDRPLPDTDDGALPVAPQAGDELRGAETGAQRDEAHERATAGDGARAGRPRAHVV